MRAMPNRERCKAYYERLKLDPLKWVALKSRKLDYMRNYRSKRVTTRVVTPKPAEPSVVTRPEDDDFFELTLDTEDSQDG